MLPLLLGALTTLVTTTFVQLRIVPRVEARKRAEDRWERDVRTLGEFLAFEYADAVRDLRTVVAAHVVGQGPSASADLKLPDWAARGQHAEWLAEQLPRLRQLREGWQRSNARVEWLVSQILQYNYLASALDDLRSAHTDMLIAESQAEMLVDSGTGLGDFEDIVEKTDALGDAQRKLVRAVKRLASNPPPPPPRTTLRSIVTRSRRV